MSEERAGLSVGVNTIAFMWRMEARDALESLAQQGYRNFELMGVPYHFDPMMPQSEAERFATFLHEADLRVETINLPSLDQNLASASADMRDFTVKLYTRLIAIAKTIGARGVVTVTGRVNPLIQPPRPQLEQWFGESFLQLLGVAERSGIKLLLENIPMGVYARAEELIAFADRLDSPAVGICYDIANAHFIGEDAAAGLHTLRSRLDVVHLSDTAQDFWRHAPVGEGTCDFAAFATALREIGYDKTSMLEIVADAAETQIVSSHEKLAALGWQPLH